MSTIEKLKSIQADAMAFFVKTHNYHWNVKGMQFFPVHEMTEKIYDKFAEVYDDTAERVLQLGGKPVLTMGQIAQTTNIKEESGSEFDAKYVLEAIKADYEYFVGEFKALAQIADEAQDATTVAYAEDMVAGLEKDIWMINQSLQ
jgi:starvation-inducible DNA-binding protein